MQEFDYWLLGKRLVRYERSFAPFAADLHDFGLVPAPTGRHKHRKIYVVARIDVLCLTIGAYCRNREFETEKAAP